MPDTYATLVTSRGEIRVQLFSDTAPETVENFVGLATGSKPWADPRTGSKQSRPLYEGTIFHRVIPQFMIQGGDPLGNGRGGPGYTFEDEVNGPHRFDQPGRLAMANAGPNTNGSQFFITQAPRPGWTASTPSSARWSAAWRWSTRSRPSTATRRTARWRSRSSSAW